MTDVEKRVRAAFDSAHVPPQVTQRTLARIEALRAEEVEAAPESSRTAVADYPAPRPPAQGTATSAASLGAASPLPLASRPAAHMPAAHAASHGEGAAAPLSHPETRTAAPAPPRSSGAGNALPPNPATQTAGGEKRRARRNARSPRRARLVAALAACAVLIALGIGGVAWAVTPYAYVTVDVNPSLELGINRLDRVTSTRAYNDDGARVLAAADVQGDTYEDAMTALETALQEYVASGAPVELAVVCDNQRTATMLENVGTRCLEASGGQVHCSHASSDDHHAASELDMGVARYHVYRALADAGVELSADDARNMSMRELLDMARQNGVQVDAHEGASHGNASATTSAGADAGTGTHRGEGHDAAEEHGQRRENAHGGHSANARHGGA